MKKFYIKILLSLIVFFSLLGGFYFLYIKKTPSVNGASLLNNKKSTKETQDLFFIGTDNGLYKITHRTEKLLDQKVQKILPAPHGIWVLTQNDILYSENNTDFKVLSDGIRKKVIKSLHGKKTSIIKENELLKDISIDPYNENHLITAGFNGVYVSLNKGISWEYYPSNSATNGIKSVAIFSWKNDIHILFGHPYQGIYYKNLTKKQSKWTIIPQSSNNKGFFRNEISSILIEKNKDQFPIIYAGQNFSPLIYKVSLQKKYMSPFFNHPTQDSVEMLESLQDINHKQLMYVNNQGIFTLDKESKNPKKLSKINSFIDEFTKQYKTPINSISTFYENKHLYTISELWMLQKAPTSPYIELSKNKKGIYIQADVLNSAKRFPELLKLIQSNGLNMVVVDMKDDFGYLRFKTDNPLLLEKGAIKGAVNLKTKLKKLKDIGVYVVARIPAFKDPILFKYNNGEYTIQDKTTLKPWVGMKKTKSGNIVPNKEYWVDPYNEKVWEYTITLSQELIKQGIDEIQFDYIRFPTDGINLKNMSFPSQVEGMDKESALISFLKYARNQIKAPISVDIYGANGWMRTGSRTGQDVELLSLYTDVIAPMYYPSHFGESFLNYAPYEDRPYRIYHQGSYRNYYIARKKTVIRPYLQAFSLPGNTYDKAYYNKNYINKQIQGTDDSVNLGYTFWNSATRYAILYSSILNKTT